MKIFLLCLICIITLSSCKDIKEVYTETYAMYDKKRFTAGNIYHKNPNCKGIEDKSKLKRIDIKNLITEPNLCPVCISSSLKDKIEKQIKDIIKQNKIKEDQLDQGRLEWIKKKRIIRDAFYNPSAEILYTKTRLALHDTDINNYSFYQTYVSISDVQVVSENDLFVVENNENAEFQKLFPHAKEIKIYFIDSNDDTPYWIVTEKERTYGGNECSSNKVHKESGLKKILITDPK